MTPARGSSQAVSKNSECFDRKAAIAVGKAALITAIAIASILVILSLTKVVRFSVPVTAVLGSTALFLIIGAVVYKIILSCKSGERLPPRTIQVAKLPPTSPHRVSGPQYMYELDISSAPPGEIKISEPVQNLHLHSSDETDYVLRGYFKVGTAGTLLTEYTTTNFQNPPHLDIQTKMKELLTAFEAKKLPAYNNLKAEALLYCIDRDTNTLYFLSTGRIEGTIIRKGHVIPISESSSEFVFGHCALQPDDVIVTRSSEKKDVRNDKVRLQALQASSAAKLIKELIDSWEAETITFDQREKMKQLLDLLSFLGSHAIATQYQEFLQDLWGMKEQKNDANLLRKWKNECTSLISKNQPRAFPNSLERLGQILAFLEKGYDTSKGDLVTVLKVVRSSLPPLDFSEGGSVDAER